MVKKIFTFSALLIIAAATVLVTSGHRPGAGVFRRLRCVSTVSVPVLPTAVRIPEVLPAVLRFAAVLLPTVLRRYHYGQPRYYGVYPRTGYSRYGYRWR